MCFLLWYLTRFIIVNASVFKVLCDETWGLLILLKGNGETKHIRVKKNTHLKCLNEDIKDLIFLCLQQRALCKFKSHINFKV